MIPELYGCPYRLPMLGSSWLNGSAPDALEQALEGHAYVDPDTHWEPSVACDPVAVLDDLAERGFVVVRRELLRRGEWA